MEAKRRIFDHRKKSRFQMDDEYLNGYAKLCGWKATIVYTSLCRHADRDQFCFPSIDKMAEEHRVHRTSIMEGLKSLQEWNIVQVTKKIRRKDGSWLQNSYILLDKTEWKPKPYQVAHSDMDEPEKPHTQVANSDMETEEPKSPIATQPSRPERPSQVAHSDTKETHSKNSHIKDTPYSPSVDKGGDKNLIDLIEPFRGQFAPKLIEDFILRWDEKDTNGIALWQKQDTWETYKRLVRYRTFLEDRDREQNERRRSYNN